MTDERRSTDLATFVTQLPRFEMLPHLIRLVARGTPVTIAEVAGASPLPAASIEGALRSQRGTDWDDDGRVVGFGLTQRPTAHRFIVAGRTLYTFCATDALIFTPMLGESATVESACPATGKPIRLELAPTAVLSADPAATVVSQLHDPAGLGDVRRLCDQGNFYSSADAAAPWAAEHPGGRIVPVEEAFEESLRVCENLGWSARSVAE